MRAQRVDKLLVTNGVEAATVAALAAGNYVGLVHGKTANTPLVKGDKFQIVVEGADGSHKYSDVIKTDDIISVKLEAYAAAVQQVITITFATPVAGQEYAVYVVNKSDKEVLQRRQDKRSYQVIAETGETVTTLGDKFRALINADEASSVVASGTTTLVLTAKTSPQVANAAGQFPIQNYFDASALVVDLYGQYQEAGTVVYTTAPNFGSGTFPQVRTLEAYTVGYEGGSLNRTSFPVPVPNYSTVAGTNYDLIVIEYDNNYWSNSVVAGKVDSPITLVLAVTAGATEDLEAFLANFITA